MRCENRAPILLLVWLVLPVCLAQERDSEDALEDTATIERKAWVSMRDGVRLSTDIYRPKDAKGPLPTIFWRTPYNYNTLRGGRSRMAKQAIENGYAFVIQNERGKYFSEGEWEILGRPRTDGYDTLDFTTLDQQQGEGAVGAVADEGECQHDQAEPGGQAEGAQEPASEGGGKEAEGRHEFDGPSKGDHQAADEERRRKGPVASRLRNRGGDNASKGQRIADQERD